MEKVVLLFMILMSVCVHPLASKSGRCAIPQIEQGLMIEVLGTGRGGWYYEKRYPEDLVKNGSSLLLKCNKTLELPEENINSVIIRITCQNGALKPKPSCDPVPQTTTAAPTTTEQTTEQTTTKQTTEQAATEQTTEQTVTEQTTEQTTAEQTTEQTTTEQTTTVLQFGNTALANDTVSDEANASESRKGDNEALHKDTSQYKNCSYENNDKNLLIFVEDQLMPSAALPNGSVIKFRCNTIGAVRLHGVASAVCSNGQWTPAEFPKCLFPSTKEGVGVFLYSDKTYKIRLAGEALVWNGSKVEIICFSEIEESRPPKLYHSDLSKSIFGKEESTFNGSIVATITLESMKEEYVGTYVCSFGTDSHNITLTLADAEDNPFESGRCWPAPEIENGYKDGGSNVVDSEVKYRCERGYKLIGRSILRCNEYGLWSHSFPTCIEIRCRTPAEVANGALHFTSLRFDAIAKYRCKKGYKLVGNRKLRCNGNGEWTNSPPVCEEIRCPPPAEVASSAVSFTSLRFGATAEYRCKIGYRLVGKSIAQCNENGEWTNSPPICEEILCPIPANINDGQLHFVSLKMGSITEYKCHQGYELIGNRKSICNENGEWSNSPPLCTMAYKCRLPKDIDNGYNVVISTDVGGTVVYKCHKGFQLKGSERITCKPNGLWSSPEPKCIEIHCSLPPRVSNGKFHLISDRIFLKLGITFGSIARYTCDEGYTLIGNEELVCDENELWSGAPPTCEVIRKCSLPKDIENGYKVATSTAVGDTVEYKCHKGFQLRGSERITCEPSGSWSSPEPKCLEIYCSVPPTVINGKFHLSSNLTPLMFGITFGSIARYTCDNGYTLTGNGKLVCDENGQWSGTLPTCEVSEILCSPPVNILNGQVHFISLRIGSEIEYRCHLGYVLIGNSRSVCRENGEWSNSPPSCRKKFKLLLNKTPHCSSYDLIDNLPEVFGANITQEHMPSGSLVQLACAHPSGIIVGSKYAYCTSKGYWIIRKTKCVIGCKAIEEGNSSSLIIGGLKDTNGVDDYVTFSCPEGEQLLMDLVVIICLSTGWSEDRVLNVFHQDCNLM